jgi:cobalt-zinc-cadmium efflux system protein
MGHDHGHGHSHAGGRAEDRSRLKVVLAVTGTVLVIELVGAWLAGSLALLADAGHMATDTAAIVLALGASYVAARPAGKRTTFGLHRAEVLAALLNALVLLGVCAYLAYAGTMRLVDPGDTEVRAGLLIAFAAAGLLANAVSLLVLSRGDHDSLNVRGAFNEVLADTLGSVLALVAGAVIWLWDLQQADAIASLLIAVLILPRSISLLRDAAVVLLEIAPQGLDLDEVRHHLLHVPGVVDVHDLHAWTITSGIPSLSAHVTVTEECLAERGVGATLDALSTCVTDHFEVRHTTFQVEPGSHRAHEDLGEVH